MGVWTIKFCMHWRVFEKFCIEARILQQLALYY